MYVGNELKPMLLMTAGSLKVANVVWCVSFESLAFSVNLSAKRAGGEVICTFIWSYVNFK